MKKTGLLAFAATLALLLPLGPSPAHAAAEDGLDPALGIVSDGIHRERVYAAEATTSKQTRLGVNLGDSYPAVYDLRTANPSLLLNVRDQGTQGTCWAFTATGVANGTVASAGLAADANSIAFSTQHLAYAAGGQYGTYRVGGSATDPIDRGGGYSYTVGAWANWHGPALASDFPFGTAAITDWSQINQAQFHLADAISLSSPYTQSGVFNASAINTVKWYVQTYGPIGFDLAARSKSPATKANYYDSNGNPDQADHMEIIVGWDDSYNSFTLAAAPPPGPGAWIVQNSWGTSFGDAGYHYVSYYDKTITAFDWYSFLSPTQHTINNSYAINANYSYPAKYSGKSLTAMLAANVYTAAQPMRLDAVQISNYTAGTNYTVSVYRGVSGVPNSGTITAATASRTNATFGLHYETLSQPVNLLAGEKYAIVVRYTLPTAGAYGPLMELETGTAQSYDGFTFSFDTPANMKLQAGQSYLAFDSTWWDLTTMGKGNGFTVGNNLLNGYANPVTVTGAWLDGAQATSAYQSDVSMLRQGSIAFAFSDGRTELLPLSNPNVAVTGYNTAKLGAQTVQVSAYGYTFTFPITMRKPPKLVDSLHTPSTPLYVKQGTYYQFSVGAFLGKTLTSQPISYKSSNTKVLAVSKTGLLSAYPVKKKTKVVLTVTSNVKTQKFTVYVVPKTLKVSGGKLTVQSKLKVGEYAFAKLTFTGTNPAVSYSSSNSKILKVNKYGLVIAKKKGKAKITAKVGSKKYTKTVKVV